MALTEADIARKLFPADMVHGGGRRVRVMFLLPESLWRPIKASWWKGKESYLIGGDEHGNYILRHCDGTVRLWDHSHGVDEVLAPSVRTFVDGLKPAVV
jgi:hypothetical protein